MESPLALFISNCFPFFNPTRQTQSKNDVLDVLKNHKIVYFISKSIEKSLKAFFVKTKGYVKIQ